MTRRNNKKLQYENSFTSRLLRTVAILIMLIAGGILSFNWSFNETYKVGFVITGTPLFAKAFTIVVQIGPNALLAFFRKGLAGWQKGLLYFAVVLLNLVNFLTNYSAFNLRWEMDSMLKAEQFGFGDGAQLLIWWLGVITCFAVTLYEEVGLKWLSVAVHHIGMMMNDLGFNSPKWLLEDLPDALGNASGL